MEEKTGIAPLACAHGIAIGWPITAITAIIRQHTRYNSALQEQISWLLQMFKNAKGVLFYFFNIYLEVSLNSPFKIQIMNVNKLLSWIAIMMTPICRLLWGKL